MASSELPLTVIMPVFVSLLSNWILGMLITILLFKLGRWKRKIPASV